MDEINVKGIKHPVKVYKVIDYFEKVNSNFMCKDKIEKFLLEINPKLKDKESVVKEIEKFLEKKLLEANIS